MTSRRFRQLSASGEYHDRRHSRVGSHHDAPAVNARRDPVLDRRWTVPVCSTSLAPWALDEHWTACRVREIRRAMVSAAALTDRPEYVQARAEVRQRKERRWWRS